MGLTEQEARDKHGARLEVVTSDYAGNDRAIATGQTTGRIKLMAVKGRPVGVTIAGAEAGELITLWALALSKGLKLSDISGMVVPYPTLSDLAKAASGAYFSPRLFDNPWVERAVRAIQRVLP